MDGRHYKNPPPIPYRAPDSIPKLTFGKGEPYHCGWQGWKDHIPVLLDGTPAGELVGSGPNKRRMEYGLRTEDARLKRYPAIALPIGIAAAKKAVEAALIKGRA